MRRGIGTRFGPVAVQPLLEEAAAGAHPAQGVELTVSCAPGLTVLADPDLLEQALANLVANASKYTERGRIELIAQPARPGGVTIEVRDTGRGMGAAEREAAAEGASYPRRSSPSARARSSAAPQIMRHLWGSDRVGDEHPCDVHVSNIRRKIERDPRRARRGS